MYRRVVCNLSLQLFTYRLYSSNTVRDDELEKEKSLREKLLQKYPHLKFQALSSLEYGSFSDSQIKGEIGTKARSSGSRTLLLICVAGLMVFWISELLQDNYSINNLTIPLWTASNSEKAKHFLFAIQFDKKNQKALLSKFNSLKRVNPLLDFFSWIEYEHPDFCQGRKYTKEVVLHTILNALQHHDISKYVMITMDNRNIDEKQRVDMFIDSISTLSLINFIGYRTYTPNALSSSFSISDNVAPPGTVLSPSEGQSQVTSH